MEALRVLHVIRPEPLGSLGGADLHVLDLCVAQAQQGLCRPSVLALGASKDFLLQAKRRRIEVLDPFARRACGGYWATALLRPQRIDLVHAHGYEADYAAVLAKLAIRSWRALPCVITCHGLIASDLRHRLMSVLNVQCMRRAQALVATCDASGEGLRKVVPAVPVHAVPNGIPLPDQNADPAVVKLLRRQLGADPPDMLVGFVGRLSREKRPDLFLRAAELAAAGHPHARFAYVGGGTLADRLRIAVSASSVAHRTVLVGLRHDIDMVYAGLDVIVVPSDTEGTPRVVLEAQAHGVAVVATAVGGVPCLIEDGLTGLLCPPGNAPAIADALSRLLSDATLRRDLACRARQRVQGDTAARMAQAVQSVYEAVITAGP